MSTAITSGSAPRTASRRRRPGAASGRLALRGGRALLLGAVPVLLASTLGIFLLTYLANSDPAAQKLGDGARPQDIARLNHAWGLDRGFFAQYWHWLSHAVTGDFGVSYLSGVSVGQSIGQRLPVDLSIALVAIVVAIVVGFAAGLVAAARQGGVVDRVVSLVASILVTIPEFWLAIMAVVLFSVTLSWLPSAGWVPFSQDPGQWLQHLLLPGGSLGLTVAAYVALQLRTSLLTEMEQDYVVGARVRGLSPRRILLGHALRNASAPAIATIGLAVPTILGGVVIAESIFGLPGLGQYALDGAQSGDVPVIQGVLLVSIVVVLACNLVVDGLLVWLRPATRRSHA